MPRLTKFTLYPDEIVFVKKNYNKLTNRELFEHCNEFRSESNQLKFIDFRSMLYVLGLKRNEVVKWLPREEQFLLNNYKKKGNKAICEALNKYKNRSREFTDKTIWKKMKLLKIKRTPEQIARIKQQHIANGVWKKSQAIVAKNRKKKEGEIWKVRINNIYYWWTVYQGIKMDLRRARYMQHIGPLKPGQRVYSKDGDQLNCSPENLTTEVVIYRKVRQSKSRMEISSRETIKVKPNYNPKRYLSV